MRVNRTSDAECSGVTGTPELNCALTKKLLELQEKEINMTSLPTHGRVNCTKCFNSDAVKFDQTKEESCGWRITSNPLAWGNENAEIVVLGFSKGPTQAGALSSTPHDDIAYKGSRLNVGKILAHVGLIPPQPDDELKKSVNQLISDKRGKFHFASLINLRSV